MYTKEQIAAMTPDQLFAAFQNAATAQADLTTAKTQVEQQLTEVTNKHNELAGNYNQLGLSLQSTKEDLSAALEAKAQTEQEAVSTIEKLSKTLSDTQNAAAESILTITVGGKLKKVVGKKFNIGGLEITAAELIKNEDLLEKLVRRGSGILVDHV